MGLSNEERLSKTYWQLMWWRRSLVSLRDDMPNEWSKQKEARAAVDGWISRVDRITGRLIAKRDATGAYWFSGSKDDNYRSHFDVLEFFNVPKDERYEYNSYESFERMAMTEFVRRLSEGAFKTEYYNQARVVAAWWTMWGYVDAILYPVYRYDDDLFPSSFHDDLCTLFGEIANRRYEIIAANDDKDDVRAELLVEQATLSKWKLFHIRLEAADPWKTLSDKKRGTYDEVKRRKPFPGFEMIEEIGKMSLAQVKDALKKHEDAEYKSRAKWNKQQADEEAKKPKKIDGVLGPQMRTAEELHRIVDTSLDRAEAIAAGEELSNVHHTYANWEAQVDARLNPKKAKKKTKKTKR